MKVENKIIGHLGELIAKNYLIKKGYKIIEQNYQNKYLEIDLVATFKQLLIFIEVKTRVGDCFGEPEEALDHHKIKRLVRNATLYVVQNKYCRIYHIDAICIVLNKEKKVERFTHYKNITQ